jgi:hypothetical protein
MFNVRYERSLYILLRCCGTMSWLSRLVAGLSSQRPRFNSSSVDVRFVVDKNGTWTGISPSKSVFP